MVSFPNLLNGKNHRGWLLWVNLWGGKGLVIFTLNKCPRSCSKLDTFEENQSEKYMHYKLSRKVEREIIPNSTTTVNIVLYFFTYFFLYMMFLHGYDQLYIQFWKLLLPPNTETQKVVAFREAHNLQGHLKFKKMQNFFSKDIHSLNSIPSPLIICLWFFNKRNFKQKSVYVAVDLEQLTVT